MSENAKLRKEDPVTGFRASPDLMNTFRSKLAAEGLKMNAVIVGWIHAYMSGQISTGVRGLGAQIPQSSNGPSPTITPKINALLEKIVELGATSAKLLDEARQEGAHGQDLDDPDGTKKLREIENLAGQHLPGKVSIGSHGSPKRSAPAGSKKIGGAT